MKKVLSFILISVFMLGLVGCKTKDNELLNQDNVVEKTNNQFINYQSALIVYFTFPETDDVDISSSASRVIDNEELMGATEYVAQIIHDQTSGELFQITTEQIYPGLHEPLVDQASKEKERNARPILKETVKNIEDYDLIFIGYPNWWGDMPMPLYSFLEQHDLSGKTIIPFNTHGGSGFSNTIETIQELQLDAKVIKEGLSISRNEVIDSKDEIINWIEGLGLKYEK